MRVGSAVLLALAVVACAHVPAPSDAQVVQIAERSLKIERLAEKMDCHVTTQPRIWDVNCQVREANTLDGGIYVSIDRSTRRVVKVRHDS